MGAPYIYDISRQRVNKLWNNKFYYKLHLVGISTESYYDAQIHEYQMDVRLLFLSWCVGSGPCNGLIIRPEVSYRARLILCELEISIMKRPRPDLACWAAEKVIIFICYLFRNPLSLRVNFLAPSGQNKDFCLTVCAAVWFGTYYQLLEEPAAYLSRARKLELVFLLLETLVYVWQATGQHVAKANYLYELKISRTTDYVFIWTSEMRWKID